MAKEEKTSVISDKTKIVLAIPQAIAVIVFILAVSGGFAVLGEHVNRNTASIQEMKQEKENEMKKLFEEIQRIRESQIRMEGKLDLKQDKFSK